MKTTKHIYNSYYFILVVLLFLSCKDEKNNTTKIIWKTEYLSNDTLTESEWYFANKKDSAKNQYKIIKDGIIDTLKSHFYHFGNIESSDGENFSGSLKFYSVLDSTQGILNKEVEFSFIQQKSDSVYYKDYVFNNKNELNFEYSKIKKSIITGFIREVLTVETNDKNKVRIIENITLVDSDPHFTNPAIDRIMPNKK